MTSWELIDCDPYRRVRKFIANGDEPGSILVRTEFDDQPLLQINKALQNEPFDRRKEIWHAAAIPASVMYEWLVLFGVNAWNPAHNDAVRRLLNSPDYRWCKVKNIII
jgi:hypothetical protein